MLAWLLRKHRHDNVLLSLLAGLLERICILPALSVHEARLGFRRNVWVDRMPFKAALAVEARFFERSLRRDVLCVAGCLDPKEPRVFKDRRSK
jgi:hypothetical protein